MFTHMPFLHPGGILFAAGESPAIGEAVRWKLMRGISIDDSRKIDTGLPENVIECSPSLALTADGVELVFIAQDSESYRFYVMRGQNIDQLTTAAPLDIINRAGAHAGTRNAVLSVVDRPEIAGMTISSFGSDEVKIIFYPALGIDAVARITFDHAHPWRMLVSGSSGNEWHTTLYDAKTGFARRIVLADGSGVYKASILGDRMAYAARLSNEFEAREIRFAENGEWRLEPLPSDIVVPPVGEYAISATRAAINMEPDASTPSSVDIMRNHRERTLRANCAVGTFCEYCRRNIDTRTDLETLGIVDRLGNGCPRNLPWIVSDAALNAVRPFVADGIEKSVWCERFMVGTTPAQCQKCIDSRNSRDPDIAAQWLMKMTDTRSSFTCSERIKTEARRVQACCGRPDHEVAVYTCNRKGGEVFPADCAACIERIPTNCLGVTPENALC